LSESNNNPYYYVDNGESNFFYDTLVHQMEKMLFTDQPPKYPSKPNSIFDPTPINLNESLYCNDPQEYPGKCELKQDKPLVDNNPKTAAANKKPKLSDVPPVAFFALGAAMSDGATKYGQFNWRDTSVTSSIFYDAMHRHLAAWYNGEDFAQDSKINHLAHIMASCAILLDADEHGVFNDDRDKRLPFPPTDKSYKG